MSEPSMSENDVKPRKPRKGLGRGLDALLGEALRDDQAGQLSMQMGEAALIENRGVAQIAIADIKPNPGQPRRHFDAEALEELASSIARHGIVQPIVLRPHAKGYQIVAGERRWRAAQKARLHQVPAIIRDYSDDETLEIALLENIQRRDLNAIEEAEAYKKLCDEFGHSQAELGKIVGKSRSHVANMMRLLELPVTLRDLVVEERLSMGHARALLGVPNAVELSMVVIRKGLSVRQTEAMAREAQGKRPSIKKASATHAPMGENDADIRAVENHLGDLLGLKVHIQQRDGRCGAVTFEYRSLDQLDMLCQRLTGESF